MKQITFHLETLTPMFMSGANQGKFELRPPSIKGLLRFWWRAYFWGSKTVCITPEELEQEEGKIFGTTSKSGQKSRFSLRIQNLQKQQSPQSYLQKYDEQLYKYLSYGAKPPAYYATFDLVLDFPDATYVKEVIMSLYFLTLFGSLGAKSRNGFGNVLVKNPEIFNDYGLAYLPLHIDVLDAMIRNTNIPNFSAFSRDMKTFRLKTTQKTAEKCHAELGRIYKESKRELDTGLNCEKRQYIAAPIVVRKRGNSRPFAQSPERLAKPYFLRILPEGEQFRGYILYFPSKICRSRDNDYAKAQKYREMFNTYLQQQGMQEVTLWQNP